MRSPRHPPDALPHSGASEEERLLLAIQKPQVTGAGTDDGTNYVTIEFKSGPNLGGQYGLACYGTEPDVEPLTCGELAGVEPEAVVDPQDLPKLYGNVANNVTGMTSETVDCYVWADGISGKVDKCQFVDRVSDAFVGTDWVSGPGISCDDACFAVSGTCDVGGMLAVDTEAKLGFVADLLGFPVGSYQVNDCTSPPCGNVEPGTSSGTSFAYGSGSTCAASNQFFTRFCCCGPNCPVA